MTAPPSQRPPGVERPAPEPYTVTRPVPDDTPKVRPSPTPPLDASPAPAPAAVPAPAPAPKSKRRRLLLLVPILLAVGGFALTIAYRYWYDSTFFVMTDNAQVTGDLVQVGSLNAGRLVTTRLEVGDRVKKDEEMAVVSIPQQVGSAGVGGAAKLQETGSGDAMASVRSPLNGIVAARMTGVGSTVSPGQPIYALVDPSQVWVKANIEEDRYSRLRPGQPVEVHVDALNRSFPGQIVSVTPASAATFSLLPSQNTSGNFTKVTQLVPVKIAVDSGDAVLPLGTSVEVKIQVREPGAGLPWQP